MNWKVKLPREKPPIDSMYICIGAKTHWGIRFEVEGQIKEKHWPKVVALLEKYGLEAKTEDAA